MPPSDAGTNDPADQGPRLTIGAARIMQSIRDGGPDGTVHIDPESIDEDHNGPEARHLRLLISEGYLAPISPGSHDYRVTTEGLAALEDFEAKWREIAKHIGMHTGLVDTSGLKNVVDRMFPALGATQSILASFNVSFALQFQPVIENLIAPARVTDQWATQILEASGLGESLRMMSEIVARSIPRIDLDLSSIHYGWDCLLVDPDEFNVPEFLADTGIPLAGSTPPAVAQALMAANPDDRETVLLTNRAAILAQCRRVLVMGDGDHEASRHLTSRAIALLEEGQYEGAQALASCALEPLLGPIYAAVIAAELVPRPEGMSEGQYPHHATSLLKHRTPGSLAAEVIPPVVERYEATLGNFPWAVTVPVLLSALTHQDNVPPGGNYSRHATVHPRESGHFTEVNAMRAVMTVVSLAWATQPTHA